MKLWVLSVGVIGPFVLKSYVTTIFLSRLYFPSFDVR